MEQEIVYYIVMISITLNKEGVIDIDIVVRPRK